MKSVSVVIPNYNGAGLLEKYLPPLKKVLSDHVENFEIIVVDDASQDTSVEFIRQQHPDVTVIVNEVNLGFGGTMNRGIHAAQGDILFSLNSDVLVDSDIFGAVLPHFSDPRLFAVTPNIIDPRSGYNQAVYRLKPGVCWYTDTCLQTVPAEQEVPLFFACAGACFYDRAKLLELGGFDPLFSPFYVEDVDLSYQAWKRGWRCVLEPSATVYHFSNSTIEQYHRKRKIKFLTARNKTYFMWLNVTDSFLVWRYWLCFLPSLLWDIVSFRKYKFVGTFMALPRFFEVMRKRSVRRRYARTCDSDIIKLVSYRQ
jgi:GT2 family glycosyltransferase